MARGTTIKSFKFQNNDNWVVAILGFSKAVDRGQNIFELAFGHFLIHGIISSS